MNLDEAMFEAIDESSFKTKTWIAYGSIDEAMEMKTKRIIWVSMHGFIFEATAKSTSQIITQGINEAVNDPSTYKTRYK